MNIFRLKKLYSFGCENYIKFVSMKVKSFDFKEEKKNDERCVGRIWRLRCCWVLKIIIIIIKETIIMNGVGVKLLENKIKNCMGYLLTFVRRFK